ncbi:hypothetical protein NSPZN2_40102 [Nitrospira defluvii]|uniref:Uncharacterized protein n=1 Tax=Nitrospira defluvii TaxID=330214 RepID=A0ABM8RR95_9BACT|nr:hypothetical protein NSPZN2_40102 [Nitrospira defluvii]
MGLLTYGSSRLRAFPTEEVLSTQLSANSFTLMANDFLEQWLRAESLPAYSGGTVMDLHHLPRR